MKLAGTEQETARARVLAGAELAKFEILSIGVLSFSAPDTQKKTTIVEDGAGKETRQQEIIEVPLAAELKLKDLEAATLVQSLFESWERPTSEVKYSLITVEKQLRIRAEFDYTDIKYEQKTHRVVDESRSYRRGEQVSENSYAGEDFTAYKDESYTETSSMDCRFDRVSLPLSDKVFQALYLGILKAEKLADQKKLADCLERNFPELVSAVRAAIADKIKADLQDKEANVVALKGGLAELSAPPRSLATE